MPNFESDICVTSCLPPIHNASISYGVTIDSYLFARLQNPCTHTTSFLDPQLDEYVCADLLLLLV